MRVWCVTHQRNETLTGREVELVFYAIDWLRADLIVDGSPGYRRDDATSEDLDQLDHLRCPRELANDLDLAEIEGRAEFAMVSAVQQHVLDCYERRVADDQRARAAGEVPR